MISKLDVILRQKEREIAKLYQQVKSDKQHRINKIVHGDMRKQLTPCFKDVLRTSALSIIAEIKRKSPSKGVLASIADPVAVTQRYIDGGASAISVLTDQTFFCGSLTDLTRVTAIAHPQSIPVLRKDFILDRVQIAEAAIAGANAVLLIVSILKEKLQSLLDFAYAIGLQALVEVYTYDELQIAIDSGAQVIGINNRNLHDFTIDNKHALRLVQHIPLSIIKVAESGITNPELAKQYYAAGFDAVLIGEALVTVDDPAHFIRACRHE